MTTKFGKRTDKEPNYLGTAEKIELVGHNHNIPNIDFNETGRYIASVSVDTTCRVWDLFTRQTVTQKKSSSREINQDSWCWSAKFIKPGNFKHVICADKGISKLYQQKLFQGRLTSLSHLGLCHSASNPAFPINVSRVFDLEEEDIDFEIYEGSGEGGLYDDMWDNRLLEEEDNYMEEVYERQRMEDEYNYNFGDSYDPDEASEILRPLTSQEEHDPDYEIDQDNYADYDEYDGDTNVGELMLSLASAAAAATATTAGRRGNENQITEEEWAATITDTGDANHDGWGDPLNSPEQQSPSSTEVWESTIESETMQVDTDDAVAIVGGTNSPPYCIPNIIRSTSNSSIPQLANTATIVAPRLPKNGEVSQKTLGEYVMITTTKDVILATTTIPCMHKIRAEHDMINKVDIRSDQLLSVLDRISMVEWLPELELFIAASQKGTVALMRLLQVEFEDGHQACLFNNEYYLPSDVLQSTPLYGKLYIA